MRQIIIVSALALLSLPFLYAGSAQTNTHAKSAMPPPPVLTAYTTSP